MATSKISALGSVSFGWLHNEGGFLFDESFFLDPLARIPRERRIHEFVAARFPNDPIYNIEAHLVQLEGRRQPVVLVGGLQPNLTLGAAAGAQFVFYGDKDPDITQTPLAAISNLDALSNIAWSSTWPVSLFLDQIHAVRSQVGPEYVIVPPFFWDATGRATIHGIVTTAQKLIGERVFLEIAEPTGFIDELFSWIVESYSALIRLFADAAGRKVTELHVGDCSLCMVGPEQFHRRVLPHLNRLARSIGPLRLHSCGNSDHLLEVFQDVDNLVCLNVGSNTSLAKIRERFGLLHVDLLPDTQFLLTATPAAIDAWVRRCVTENGDGQLQLQYHLDLGQPEVNCLQIHRTLESLGFSSGRVPIY